MHTKSEEISNMAAVRKEIAQMQVQDPNKSFAQCWAILQKQKPHLFKTTADYDREAHPIEPAKASLSPGRTFQETMRLYRSMSPGQLVQAHLNGMLEDGTTWNEDITRTCLAARPILSRPFDHTARAQSPSKLDKRVHELQQLNAGISMKEILSYLQETEPDLFPEQEDLSAKAKIQTKQEALNDAVAKHRKSHPEHDFKTAYHQVTQEQPELLEGLTFAIGDAD